MQKHTDLSDSQSLCFLCAALALGVGNAASNLRWHCRAECDPTSGETKPKVAIGMSAVARHKDCESEGAYTQDQQKRNAIELYGRKNECGTPKQENVGPGM